MKIRIFMSILFPTPVWAFMSEPGWHMVALTYSFKILSFNIHRCIKISCIDQARISLLLNINISLKTVISYSDKIKNFLMAEYRDNTKDPLPFYGATQKTNYFWTKSFFFWPCSYSVLHLWVRRKIDGHCTHFTGYFSNGPEQCCYVNSMWDNFKARLVASFFSLYLGSQILT